MPKSSAMRQKRIGRHLWRQRPYCAPIIQEGADDGLDSFDTGSVEWGADIGGVGELLFGAVDDGYVAKGRVLSFL